jgi:hypothetical protein
MAGMRERQSLAFPGSEDRRVLYAYEDYDQSAVVANLVRVRPDGSVAWLATPPEPQDAWVAASSEGDDVVANSWSGWQVRFAVATGAELSRVFTK